MSAQTKGRKQPQKNGNGVGLANLDVDNIVELAKRIPDLSDEEKRALLRQLSPQRKRTANEIEREQGERHQQTIDVPRNEDELHAWIKRETGFDIPRVAVCEDHCAPFDFIADAYFNRKRALLVLGSRESGKTLGVSIVHYVNAETKPGYEGCTFGAVQSQAKRAYKHVKSFIFMIDPETGDRVPKPQILGDPTRSETNWKTGSMIEIITGSEGGVNSPHPNTVHADEVDLMKQVVWDESQPVDTVIPTPLGPRRFGDLRVGDEVFGFDGCSTPITKIFDLGEREVFRVEMTDGRATECCTEHLWAVSTKSGSSRRSQILRLKQLADVRKSDARGGFKYKYRIPQQTWVFYPDRNFFVHPYVLGVLIGDGCLKRRLINFRAKEREIVERVNELLPPRYRARSASTNDVPHWHITRGSEGKDGTPNEVVIEIERLGLGDCGSHDKFLPREYLESGYEQRLDLLRGLMDTDGSFTKDAYYATVSRKLAFDVRELVLSLGGRALVRKKKTSTSSFKNCGYIYEVSASLPGSVNPFYVPRKRMKFYPRSRTLDPSIRSITSSGTKQVRCIGVANSDGLYLTNDFIVTHNSRNMASSSVGPDGKRIPAQDIATSTRKSTKGLMQNLLDEVAEAKRNGHKPAWDVYAYCVAEIAAEVPSCRCADPISRVHRLVKLGQDPRALCECDKIVKGDWGTRVDEYGAERPIPRTLESVCRGRFFRSRGWMHYDDIVGKFMQNNQAVWDAQMECRRPMADGVYLPAFTRQRHCVRGWVPRPQYGRITMGIDWGGSAASVVVWFQGPLLHPVEITGYDFQPTIVPQGAYVGFDQIEQSGIGATKLADLAVAKEIAYRNQYPGWRVRGRFADMAGRQQRDDWHEHNPPLRTQWYISRDFDPTVECLQDLVGDAMLYLDINNCAGLADDFESWRQKDGREVHDESSHGPAASRYCLGNVTVLERRQKNRGDSAKTMPVVRERGALDPTGALAAVGSSVPVSTSGIETEAWRRSLGMMGDPETPGVNDWRV